jgi:hypothetical protein
VGALFFDSDRFGNLHERTIECFQPAMDGRTRCSGCLFISQRELAKQVEQSQAGVQRMFDALRPKAKPNE